MRNVLNLVAVALLSTSTLALSSPGLRGIAKKPTRVRAQREQDADARVHKTPAQVEGALRATVERGEEDDAAANFAEAHARAGGAAARALEAPANAAQVTNLSKLGALAAGRRQLSTYTEFPVGLFSTQIEAASWPNEYGIVVEHNCIIRACCASNWRGSKTCQATSSTGRTHTGDLTVTSGTAYDKVLRVQQSYTDDQRRFVRPLPGDGRRDLHPLLLGLALQETLGMQEEGERRDRDPGRHGRRGGRVKESFCAAGAAGAGRGAGVADILGDLFHYNGRERLTSSPRTTPPRLQPPSPESRGLPKFSTVPASRFVGVGAGPDRITILSGYFHRSIGLEVGGAGGGPGRVQQWVGAGLEGKGASSPRG